MRQLAVAPGPAGLLIVGFQAAGHVVVHDEPHVGLVDAHAEGQRRHDNLGLAGHERVLRRGAILRRQAGVVDARPPPRAPVHQIGDFLAPLTGRGIDDSRTRLPGQQLHQLLVFLGLRGRTAHFVMQIGSGEPGDEGLRLAQAQQLDNVLLHGPSRRGRQGDRGRTANLLAKAAQPGIVGPKVVSPFAHAMRFVDRQQLQPAAAHRLQEARAAEPLGHDIDQLILAGGHARQPLRLLVGRERAVDECRRQPQGRERVDLVFHQRDQRRDDQRQSGLHDRGQLVTQALAAAGRHDAQAILAGQHGFDHLALPGPKLGQPERLQVGSKFDGRGRGHAECGGMRFGMRDCPAARTAQGCARLGAAAF